jgi:hypothetical protein
MPQVPGKASTVIGRPSPRVNGAVKKPAPRAQSLINGSSKRMTLAPPPPQLNGVSPFEIMASRIANRVAEMAENVTFVERQQ